MRPDNIFGVAQQRRDVPHSHAGLLQKDACEGMAEAVWRRGVLPDATERPHLVELAAPEIGDYVDGLGPVHAENIRTVLLCSHANAF